jgi:hypothetical protein
MLVDLGRVTKETKTCVIPQCFTGDSTGGKFVTQKFVFGQRYYCCNGGPTEGWAEAFGANCPNFNPGGIWNCNA